MEKGNKEQPVRWREVLLRVENTYEDGMPESFTLLREEHPLEIRPGGKPFVAAMLPEELFEGK